MDGLPFWGSDINGVLIVKRQWPCHLSLPFVLLKLFYCAFFVFTFDNACGENRAARYQQQC